MKHISILAVAALCIAACSPKAEDPALSAVKAKVGSLVGEGAKVTMNTFELVDSTTFGQEIEHRIKVQEAALKQNQKYYDQYRGNNMMVNAEKKKAAMDRNKELIKGIQALAEQLGPEKLASVAYYDYKFSGSVTATDGAKTVFNEYYASLSPENEVLCVESQLKGLHKALGRVIPGYTALFKGGEEE